MAATDRRLSLLARRVRDSGCLPQDSRVLVACSGGPDSLGLLIACAELATAKHLELAVAHVDHGLRGDCAAAECERVERLARDLGLEFRLRQVNVASLRNERRRGLEEAARSARRAALTAMADELGMEFIALAHTMDDQAETLMLRLLRGAGATGLSAMASVSGRFVRPLLTTPRKDLRDALLAAEISWSTDASNFGGTAARSLLRPLMARAAEVFNESLVPGLARTASLLREDSDYLDALAEETLTRFCSSPADSSERPLRFSLRDAEGCFTALPLPIARRCIRKVLAELHPRTVMPTAEAVARVLALPDQREGAEAHVSGTVVRREGEQLLFEASPLTPSAPE